MFRNHRFFPSAVFSLILTVCSATIGNADASADLAKAQQAIESKDYATAVAILKPLAESGDSQAEILYGELYEKGWGEPLDQAKAAEWYKKGGKSMHTTHLSVSVMYNTRGHIPAEKSLVAKAEAGNVDAQFNLGVCYFKGSHGYKRDYKASAFWFQQAANQEDAQAKNNLGFMYQHGAGVPQDFAKAAELYQDPADRGFAVAKNNLGFLYARGLGVKQDYDKAVQLFQQSAAKGEIHATSNLGYMYQHGQGVDKDYAKADAMFEKAAKGGLASAEYNLGYMYQEGIGVPQDLNKSARLYQLAASQDAPAAQSDLGFMYEQGSGVPKDYKKAVEYYKRMARRRQDYTMQWDMYETPSN